uniref:Zinc metalloproteinase n=1 Tax=Parastrongyloides trichosuri TaxID=131310 RepID=A0A0N4ZDJ1_PARTI
MTSNIVVNEMKDIPMFIHSTEFVMSSPIGFIMSVLAICLFILVLIYIGFWIKNKRKKSRISKAKKNVSLTSVETVSTTKTVEPETISKTTSKRRSQMRNETRNSLNANAQKNFDSTVDGMKRLNRIQRKMLKLKNTTEETDDDEDILLEEPMGNPNLFQGDILLTDTQVDEVINDMVDQAEKKGINTSDLENKTNRSKRSIITNMYYKWTFPIPYYINSGLSASLIDNALAAIQAETCTSFNKSTTKITGKSGLNYYVGSGCWSYLGRIYPATPQDISIGSGCEYTKIVQHETFHSLGVHHEQARPDRDTFITVNTANIISGTESNFAAQSASIVSDYGVPYDYGSAMHYGRLAFSKNGLATITAKNSVYDKTMGQYERLTFNDIKLVNYKYCNSTCTTKITCYNGGYQNPRNCTICKCPDGFKGTDCLTRIADATKCGATQALTATGTAQNLTMTGIKDCYFFIDAATNYKIKITVASTNLYNYDPCYPGVGVEIKYRKDLTATGAMLCGKNTNTIITSESNNVIIRYTGSASAHSMILSYVRV